MADGFVQQQPYSAEILIHIRGKPGMFQADKISVRFYRAKGSPDYDEFECPVPGKIFESEVHDEATVNAYQAALLYIDTHHGGIRRLRGGVTMTVRN